LAGADATNKKTARLRAVFGNGLPPRHGGSKRVGLFGRGRLSDG
jgi:hypothetical protein